MVTPDTPLFTPLTLTRPLIKSELPPATGLFCTEAVTLSCVLLQFRITEVEFVVAPYQEAITVPRNLISSASTCREV